MAVKCWTRLKAAAWFILVVVGASSAAMSWQFFNFFSRPTNRIPGRSSPNDGRGGELRLCVQCLSSEKVPLVGVLLLLRQQQQLSSKYNDDDDDTSPQFWSLQKASKARLGRWPRWERNVLLCQARPCCWQQPIARRQKVCTRRSGLEAKPGDRLVTRSGFSWTNRPPWGHWTIYCATPRNVVGLDKKIPGKLKIQVSDDNNTTTDNIYSKQANNYTISSRTGNKEEKHLSFQLEQVDVPSTRRTKNSCKKFVVEPQQ